MNNSLGRRCAAEATGTFFLVLIGPGAAMVDAHTGGVIGHAGVALAFGAVVLAMVYALGHISGAHINPAVTIGFWSVGRFPLRDVAPYVAAQCAGATVAAYALGYVLDDVLRMSATVPAVAVSAAFLLEFLLSFALMFVIAAVATDQRVTPGCAGIAIGATVAMDAMMGGPLTGASMNPARTLGPAIRAGVWTAHWIYWVAPITAMVGAAWVYEVLRPAGAPAPPSGVPLGTEGPIDVAR